MLINDIEIQHSWLILVCCNKFSCIVKHVFIAILSIKASSKHRIWPFVTTCNVFWGLVVGVTSRLNALVIRSIWKKYLQNRTISVHWENITRIRYRSGNITSIFKICVNIVMLTIFNIFIVRRCH